MRVMVADQEVEYRHRLVELIQKMGHTTSDAMTGREVLEQCRKKCPDLIFVDLVLSGQSGIEVIRQIRQLGGHAVWVPIILTGKTLTDAEILQAVEAGADDVLLKPINEIRLKIKVTSAQRHLNLKEEVFQVAHELVVANRALQSVVTQDVLTGVGNSSSFEEALEREWFKARQAKTPISVMFINLDHFQAFNQSYGAEEGDRVIKRVAECLKLTLPSGNHYLARMIGDSFAVLLPNVSGGEAKKEAETLRQAIEALNIPHKTSGSSDHLTASFGIAATGPTQFSASWDLKDAADFALYQAKHTGRNRCFLATPEMAVK